MGKPFNEGTGRAFRLCAHGQDIYRSGYASEAAARKAQASILAELEQRGKAAGLEPHATTLAVAFSDYVRERLPYLRGAQPDANRINRYRHAVGLPLIHLARPDNYDRHATSQFRERALAGLAAARARGRHEGRKRKLNAKSLFR